MAPRSGVGRGGAQTALPLPTPAHAGATPLLRGGGISRTASAAATVTDAAEHVDGVAAGLEQEIERFLKRVAA